MNAGKLIYAERRSRQRRTEILDRALAFPPVDRALAPEETPAAPRCQYLQRDAAGKLTECAAPAAFRGVSGARLYYCPTCGDFVRHHLELATLAGVSLGKPMRQRRP